MNKKKFLIFGSTGFIGSNLVRKLQKTNEKIFSFSTSQYSGDKNIIHIKGDVQDESKIINLLDKKPDVIFLLVGISGQIYSNQNSAESHRINVTAHIRLLELIKLRSPKSKVVFSSSRLEYGKAEFLPVNESHPIKPLSYYGLHKHIISDYCHFLYRTKGLKTIVLRTSNPYGPHAKTTDKRYNIINTFIDKALENKELTIFGNGSQLRDYLYIDDLIEAFLAVSDTESCIGQIYNVGFGKGIKIKKIAQTIVKHSGKGKVVYRPWSRLHLKVETGSYVSDISKITKDTSWYPKISWVEGINKTIELQRKI